MNQKAVLSIAVYAVLVPVLDAVLDTTATDRGFILGLFLVLAVFMPKEKKHD